MTHWPLSSEMAERVLSGAPSPVVLAQLLVVMAVACVAGACARDAATLRWVDEWRAAERVFERGELEVAIERLEELQQRAPAPADHAMIDLRQAKGLVKLGRFVEAFVALERVGKQGLTEQDRARARYEQARVLEAAGLPGLAIPWYRRVVTAYADRMPGKRSLQHLQRLAEKGGAAAMQSYLAWSKTAYERTLQDTTIADNVVYYAATVAYDRWVEHGRDADRETAVRLLVQIHKEHYLSGNWDDALWLLSHIARRQQRWDREIFWIQQIQATREVAAFVGSYDSPFYWVGQLRIARRQMTVLDDPEAAVESYAWFMREYRKNRWRDDVLFWQGCALLRLGRTAEAEKSFDRIPWAWSQSKYLRRLDAARAAPHSKICEPREFTEAEW